MSKKKRPMKARPDIKLSQCMIVKNEEKNIEKALNWAKPITYEQIVVDTGSTDRTVEIAEKLGAKVFHFEWINDFAAAKNYAIEQASGNWIAFLDADEYLSSEDALKLIKLLEKLDENPTQHTKSTIIRTPWYHLDDKGDVDKIDEQNRIFRNHKTIRYISRIHEYLKTYGEVMYVDDIHIMHTGYANTEFKNKKKADRNIELLRIELKEKPNDMMIKAYLADSLNSKNYLNNYSIKAEVDEVNDLYTEIINESIKIPDLLKKKAYEYFIKKMHDDPSRKNEITDLCKKALNEFPDNLDFYYYYALVLNQSGEYKQAWDLLTGIDPKVRTATSHIAGTSAAIASDPTGIYGQTLIAAQGLGDVENTMKYAEIILKENKSLNNILAPYINLMFNTGTAPDKVLEKLAVIYDITSPADMIFIARAAKDCGAVEFAKMIMTIAGEMMGSK